MLADAHDRVVVVDVEDAAGADHQIERGIFPPCRRHSIAKEGSHSLKQLVYWTSPGRVRSAPSRKPPSTR
jgi:hypothetical protein